MNNVTNTGGSGSARHRLRTSGKARPTWLLRAALVCAAVTVGNAPAQGGPQPRWACSKPTVTLGDVWRGPTIECVYMISNEGEGDLEIKANGG